MPSILRLYAAMIPFDIFLALTGFALATLFTPGPNNLMLMASGANYGYRRTLPHGLGVALGFPILAMAVGLGLAAVLEAYPILETSMKVLAVAMLLWLAWKVANAAPPGTAQKESKPLTFVQATAFQWINPKAWAMALGAMAAFAATGGMVRVFLVALVFAIYGCASASVWTLIGTQVRRLLSTEKRLRIFNWTMAALVIASLLPVLIV